jgi:hypothetical protein
VGDFSGPGRTGPAGTVPDGENIDVPVHNEPGTIGGAAGEIADDIWHGSLGCDDVGSDAMGTEVGGDYICC